MTIRHQLPAYSPLGSGTLWAGLRAFLNRWTTDGGGEERRLREELVRAFSASAASLWGSGTQALQVAIEVARAARGPSDFRVALPAYSCFDLVSAAAGAAAPTVFYDLDPETLAPDLDSMDRALEGGAGAVVVSPLYGLPVPWEPIRRTARRWGAVLIEDAAQGCGTAWNGAPVGSLGEMSILSFGRGKGWTGGGGGALLLRDLGGLALGAGPQPPSGTGLAADAKTLIATAAQWAVGRPPLFRTATSLPWLHLGETRYRPPVDPRGISPVSAAIVRATRRAALREAEIRREHARWLLERLASCRGTRTIRVPGKGRPSYLRLPVRLPGGARNLEAESRALGIAPGYPEILSRIPAARELSPAPPGRFPGAEALVSELVTLPTHSLLRPRDRAALVRHVETFRAAPA